LLGAVIMFLVLGFIPCYALTALLKRSGVLRIPYAVEFAGLDHDILEQERRDAQEFSEAELREYQSIVTGE